ncbi:Gfo/Idh/MocA family oxidoreductase [Pseudomonas sp. DCB_AW]|uniref:Gfo/Idh/MocA family protein n=1 Tax=Pseudomonas sp. DCB_AW TaxID=2993596 RepID=UPI0022487EAA|nr:Gfo/Idh/MocA family oxidoreductase [Pseudomonas sp. DCB_AW]MCX2684886.1 Gfo/Idh/MocA family oxidoreductase [Pseudomonas sp. DCB_AW]
MKVVLLEVSHWHTPLYLDALERLPDVTVTAVSDATGSRGPALAQRFGAQLYDRWETLLENEKADFAFAFGPHDELYAMGEALIEQKVPFAMEKPCGLTQHEVLDLYQRTEANGLFVAVPLIWRHSELLNRLKQEARQSEAKWRTLAFRFNAGPPGRYLANSCSWMLEPKRSGGGCTINLAPHFVDLVEEISGEAIRSVSAVMYRDSLLTAVEIGSLMTLVTESGCICTIETGYNYPANTPEQREYSFSMSTDQFYARSTADGLRLVNAAGQASELHMSLNSDVYYDNFVTDILAPDRDVAYTGAGLATMHRVMRIIEAAYESDRLGGAPITL